jgi:hypothetical protein
MPDPSADSLPPPELPKPGDSGLTRLAYLRQVLGASLAPPGGATLAPARHPAE